MRQQIREDHLVPIRDEDLKDASLESVVLRSEVMFAFGTHFGAAIAVGKADPAAFCAKAELARNDKAMVGQIWVPIDEDKLARPLVKTVGNSNWIFVSSSRLGQTIFALAKRRGRTQRATESAGSATE